MKDVTKAKVVSKGGNVMPRLEENETDKAVLRINDASEINYAVMDRLGPDLTDQEG
jgi:hypothetical protein